MYRSTHIAPFVLATALIIGCSTAPDRRGLPAEPLPSSVTSVDHQVEGDRPQEMDASAAERTSLPSASVEPTAHPNAENAIYFDLASTELSRDALTKVLALSRQLSVDRRLHVTLVGHTDNLGSKEFCVALATKRNASVQAELIRLGVRAGQIHRRSRGCERTQQTPCWSDGCRRQQRRVDLLLDRR